MAEHPVLGRRALFVLLVGPIASWLACGELKTAGVDGGAVDSLDGSRAAEGDSGETDGSTFGDADSAIAKGEAGVLGPGAACRKTPLACLDPAPANVIEVTTESTLANAFATAKPGDTVQVRGKSIPSGYKIPSFVTLRGCEGATISGTISFVGKAGTIEGFQVGGSIVANNTGSFVVRNNRFVSPTLSEAGVSGRAIDGIASASVTLLVDANVFEDRERGVEARTEYDTGTHTVDINLRNNVFTRVVRPFVATEVGIVGIINVKIEHNTFFAFDTAITLAGVDRKSLTTGNLFVQGSKAIEGGSTYDLAYSFAWQVMTPAATPPLSGAFVTGDPAFVDALAGDFRLGPSSPAIDQIPNDVVVPSEDHRGCPRPAGVSSAAPKSDVGAFEAQP